MGHPPALVKGMPRPGPVPLPTHLKVLKGVRADRVNTAEPKPARVPPACPTWLSNETKREWRRVTKQLATMDLLYAADLDIIVAYAQAVVTYRQATKLVEEQGLLVPGRRDDFVTNPAVRIQRDSAQLIRQLAGELGLTPSSRSRLSVQEETANDGDALLG